MNRTTIPQENRIRAELQKEIGSRCPFCTSTDVGHFQIHHIDEDNCNHLYENLILLCSMCHSKFTKREWPVDKAEQRKQELLKGISYKRFESSPTDGFDFIGFNMSESNGRIPENIGNGSMANIRVLDIFRLRVTVRQVDGRQWTGDLNLTSSSSGQMTVQYERDYEAAYKTCFLWTKDEPLKEESLLLEPPAGSKDYGREIFIRRIISKT